MTFYGVPVPKRNLYKEAVRALPLLKGYWPLDESDAPFVDYSGNGHNATSSVSGWTAGVSGPPMGGTGVNFNLSALLTTGSWNFLSSDVTQLSMIAWGRCDRATLSQNFVRDQSSGYIVFGWTNNGDGRNPTVILSDDGGTGSPVTINVLNDGNWHMYAFTWKKNTTSGYRTFRDGVVQNSRNSANANLTNPGAAVTIGGWTSGERHLGAITHVAIINRTLSDAEIENLYQIATR